MQGVLCLLPEALELQLKLYTPAQVRDIVKGCLGHAKFNKKLDLEVLGKMLFSLYETDVIRTKPTQIPYETYISMHASRFHH